MKNIIKGALCSLAISSAMLMSCGKDEDPNIIYNDIDSIAKLKSEVVEQLVTNTVSMKSDDLIKVNVGEPFKLFENGEYNNVFSSVTSVVTVDSKGVVTPKALGSAKIYVGIDNKIAKTYQVLSLDNSKDYCYDYKRNKFSTPRIEEAGKGGDNLYQVVFCLDDSRDYYLIASFESSANNLEEFLKDQSAKFVKDQSSFYNDDDYFDLKSAENVSLTKNADGNLVFHINFVSNEYGEEVQYELNFICVEQKHSK
ncbi:MAG: hypothetical protein MJZ61_08350 [Bacteroidales bacterium]|nr:hypothetical protein [Bacteroidales bacterium]